MKLLNSKAGVTVLEGVIALGLLAVVTAGAFGVLVSASRKSSQPDMREEMTLAVESAQNLLRIYTGEATVDEDISKTSFSSYKNGLCGEDSSPLSSGVHSITCMLPTICDRTHDNSHFTYTVSSLSSVTEHLVSDDKDFAPQTRQITFDIACNGYEL